MTKYERCGMYSVPKMRRDAILGDLLQLALNGEERPDDAQPIEAGMASPHRPEQTPQEQLQLHISHFSEDEARERDELFIKAAILGQFDLTKPLTRAFHSTERLRECVELFSAVRERESSPNH
ncbi:hypothetical protein ACO2I3_01100 [Leptospira interrogans]